MSHPQPLLRNTRTTTAGDLDAAAELAAKGYALAPSVLDSTTVRTLCAAIASVLADNESDDLLRASDGHVRKLLYPLAKHHAFLLTLAHPELMQLVLDLAPDPERIVLTWEDVLLKPPRVGLGVPFHQDIALQSVGGGVFSLGLHLDDASANPLQFVPGSHRSGPLTRADVRQVVRMGSLDVVGPRAGDVLAHDVLVVHGSGPNLAAVKRWTWYLEFRSMRDAAGGPWPMEWWLDRRALLFHAAAAREAAGLSILWPPCAASETRAQWLKRPLRLRIPHESHGIHYDLSSPYNHFGVDAEVRGDA